MSIVLLKPLTAFLLALFCIAFYTERCNAQTVGLDNRVGVKDSIKQEKDTLKKEMTSGWSRLKKNANAKVKATIATPKQDVAIVSKDVNTLRKKSSGKNNKKKLRDAKEGNNLTSLTDTLHNDPLKVKKMNHTVKEDAQQKKDSFSQTVSDTLNKDSLKQKVATTFSKEKIENTLKSKMPLDDYKISKDDLKQKTAFANKANRKNFAKNNTQKLSGKLGINNVTTALKKSKDSVKHVDIGDVLKKQLTNNVKGTVSVGYEYGILPYATPENYPCGGYKSEGRLSVLLLSLPIEVTYRYSTVKSVIGINNYFRISYDVNRYKEELDKKMVVRERLKKMQLDKLQEEKQALAMKMEYAKLVGNMDIPEFSLPDTSGSFAGKWPLKFTDSVNVDTSKALSFLNKKNSYLKQQQDYLQKKDSLQKFVYEYKARYDEYKAKYDSITKVIDRITHGGEELENFKLKDKVKPESSTSKAETFLKNIKKFEIGLCNPSYSLFLVSNAPLKGVNFEYATKEHFFAVTYGTTVSTLFYNPNTLQGKMQEANNFYSFFNFNDLSNGRKVLAIKGGNGQKEGTHLFAGILVGRGKMNYLSTTDPKFGKKESNVVVEIDGKYKFSQNLNGEIIFGKSSIQSEDLSINQLKNSFREMWSSYRSNALQARINYDILKTKTKIQLTGRLIDPYFKSFGVSFLRSDNIRYEVKADQVITKNIKYSISYRREEDNLLGLINFKNTFTTIQNAVSIKFKKGLSLRLNYAPLIRKMENGSEIKRDNNSISTAVLTYVPRMKHVQANYNILYSKYRITSDSGNIHFDNLTYSHQFQFENGFKTGVNVSWFENTLKDTVNNNTYLGLADVGYTTKEQNSFTVGGKLAYRPGRPTEFGFIAKLTLHVYKTIFWEAEAEKILTGDYYSTLIEAKIKRFPYYLSTKLIINF